MGKTKVIKFEGGVEWHIQPDGKHWLQTMRLEKVFSKGEVADQDEIAWAFLNEKEGHIICICSKANPKNPLMPGVLHGVGVSCLLRERRQ